MTRAQGAVTAELIADALRVARGDPLGAIEYLDLVGSPDARDGTRRIAFRWCAHYRETHRAATRMKVDGRRIVVTRDRRYA
jgi:hypothetical protein